ncbi:hypothetical protein JAAARDRAFT_40629 [Jaapia argillacea MUCL 33604]|uniref:Methylated-DNA--protein-cysteine methyltransferase n=1 Tax=Jaapia argillacea MUCL 33604 TaxID=933084 RepID=A0A067PDX0_9AGAM|nr:hypothetical protein JAAARDRAFT_40629 [Jaapia argillacea MUCL 33604]
MPAVKPIKITAAAQNSAPYSISLGSKRANPKQKSILEDGSPVFPVALSDTVEDLAKCAMDYPLTSAERAAFRTKAGKAVTAHQWAVYDLCRTIPVGKVTTYKYMCIALGEGSPRSVGTALRNNPFAPFVPCHRIVASNHFIGGFFGEWGSISSTSGKEEKSSKKATSDDAGLQCQKKMRMLAAEGVGFSKNGYLLGGEAMIWKK